MHTTRRDAVLSADQQAFFRRHGYLKIAGGVDAAVCEGLVGLTWRLMPAPLRRDDPASWSGRIQDCCNNLRLYQRKGLVRFKDREFFRGLAEAERLYEQARPQALMRSALGRPLESFVIRGLNPNFPFPRTVSLNELSGMRLDPGHRLPWPRLPSPPQFPIFGHLETHAVELSALAYLEDVPAGAGGFAVWPGSHRLMRLAFEAPVDFLPNLLYRTLRNQMQRRAPLVLDGRRGDLILFHNRLMHSNSFNRSDRVRHAVLLDVLGKGWRRRQALPFLDAEARADKARLLRARDLSLDPLVREVKAELEVCRMSSFLVGHPRLNAAVQAISKDPRGAGRNGLSARIRRREDGDHWLVVSQGGEHSLSFKLDAYGEARHGAYRLSLNDEPGPKSRCGALVEPLALRPGPNRLRLDGRFDVDHYLRVVSTRRPICDSPILLTEVIPARSRRFTAELNLP